jgi:signal peptide peptidase SppA
MKLRGKYERLSPLALSAAHWGLEFEVEVGAPEPFAVIDDVAVVDICGPVVHSGWFFFDTYEAIKERARKAFASSCKAVVLCINSPGGDVASCFETSRALREIADAAKKPFYAIADALAASAAYSLACAADRIYVLDTAFVGSIGVIEQIVDVTAADRQYGMKYALVTSGARKADGHPHASMSESVFGEFQKHVDSLAELFFAWVAERRGVSVEHVRGLEAALFHGAGAVAAKLADGVMTKAQLLASLGKENSTENTMKALDYEKLRAELEEDSKSEDEDTSKRAKRMLAAMDDDADEKKADKPDDDKEPPKGEDEEKKDDEAAKASAAILKTLGEQDRKIQALEQKAESQERDELLDAANGQPLKDGFKNLTEGQVKFLREQPLSQMKVTLSVFQPKQPNLAAATSVTGTRGESRRDTNEPGARTPRLPPQEHHALRERMGLAPASARVHRQGTSVVFPAMSPAQATEKKSNVADGGV